MCVWWWERVSWDVRDGTSRCLSFGTVTIAASAVRKGDRKSWAG